MCQSPTRSTENLELVARHAIAEAEAEHKTDTPILDNNTNNSTANQTSISIAKKFLAVTCPTFLGSKASEDADRLVKVGRSISGLVSIANNGEQSKDQLIAGLNGIVEQCSVLATGNVKVPKVRFGKTELQMPIVSLGCMRFQQTWDRTKIKDLKDVKENQQENLVNILKYSIETLGINHIETANMYGSSEFQLGDAFQTIFSQGINREDLIIQTKVTPFEPVKFREIVEDSFKKLKLDYIDLLSFHGVNMYNDYDMIFDNKNGENLIDIAREYVACGKVKHIGFSSHGQPALIKKLIETDAFSYANIHFHAFGSYTASGGDTGGNLENAKLLKEKDMGSFIISPYDKGGKLYAPSKKLRSLTLPDLEPIQYGSMWLFTLSERENASAHTISCGAARPSDLDEPAVAAYLYANKKEETLQKVKNVQSRLTQAQIDSLGEDWVNTWHVGVPNIDNDDYIYPFGQMVWLYNLIKSFGMLSFASERYGVFDDNLKSWDFNLSNAENIGKKKIGWGYVPGIAIEDGKDYSEFLSKVPESNRTKVLDAITFVHRHCSKTITEKPDTNEEYECAYDMRPWTEFPKQG